LIVGEIGFPRREFLYDISFWETRRIIRGYKRRNILAYQLLRLTAYGSTFTMQDPNGKSPTDWLPLYFDKDDEEAEPPISEEEVADMVKELEDINSGKVKLDWG
jgi:hypothetical protein